MSVKKTITRCTWLLCAFWATLSLTACSDDDPVIPSYGEIQIMPQKDVYHVGDVITCTIIEKSQPQEGLKADSYWWYASWWFSDPEMTADFQEFDSNRCNTSSPITLTEPGEVTIYFFGRLEYPRFDFRKVEIGKKITVIE